MAVVDTDTGEVLQDKEAKQLTLAPMSDDELKKAGRKMARLHGELQAMRDDHAEVRRDHKTEEEKLEKRIGEIAATIRAHGMGKA